MWLFDGYKCLIYKSGQVIFVMSPFIYRLQLCRENVTNFFQNKQAKFMDFKSDGMMNLDLFSTFKAS